MKKRFLNNKGAIKKTNKKNNYKIKNKRKININKSKKYLDNQKNFVKK